MQNNVDAAQLRSVTPSAPFICSSCARASLSAYRLAARYMSDVFPLAQNNVDAAQLRSVTLANALIPQKKGLWWLPPAAGTLEKPTSDSAHFGGVVSGAIDGGAAEADRLLQLASKQRMNTDVRRSIFCIIMSGEDYVDAHEKLLRLKLPGKQDREILRVLVDCCMQERCFNKYYALLAARSAFRFLFSVPLSASVFASASAVFGCC